MKPDTEKKLQNILENAIAQEELAGGCLLVQKEGQELLYLEAGMADRESRKTIARDQIYRLYSMSKPITSAAIMKLMEDGKIDLAQPVSDFISSFRNPKVEEQGKLIAAKREVTVRDLLGMVSGLVYDGYDGLAGKYADSVFADMEKRLLGTKPMTTLEFAERIGAGPLAFHPGESWQYGTSADILGAIVEIASGISFGEYLEQNFFRPLNMKDTAFFVPESKKERLVTAYETGENGKLIPYKGNHLGIINAVDREPAFESGGAGLVSTVDDYARFAQMLLQYGEFDGVRVLQSETVRFMTNGSMSSELDQKYVKYFPNQNGFQYGNLLRVMKDPGRACMISHRGEYGWDGWLGCHFCNDPESQVTILFMMQKTNSGTTHLVRKLRNVIWSEGI